VRTSCSNVTLPLSGGNGTPVSLRDYAIENFPESRFVEEYRVKRGFE